MTLSTSCCMCSGKIWVALLLCNYPEDQRSTKKSVSTSYPCDMPCSTRCKEISGLASKKAFSLYCIVRNWHVAGPQNSVHYHWHQSNNKNNEDKLYDLHVLSESLVQKSSMICNLYVGTLQMPCKEYLPMIWLRKIIPKQFPICNDYG